MKLSLQPRRLLAILLAPVIACIGYLGLAAFSARWIEIAATMFFVLFHAPATLSVIKGETVSLPSYYVTVEAESSSGKKILAILGLMAVPYCLAQISLYKHLSQA